MSNHKPRVSDSSYIRAHGHKPRGIGCWAFVFHYTDRVCELWFAPADLRFSDARKQAVKVAQARAAYVVVVGS